MHQQLSHRQAAACWQMRSIRDADAGVLFLCQSLLRQHASTRQRVVVTAITATAMHEFLLLLPPHSLLVHVTACLLVNDGYNRTKYVHAWLLHSVNEPADTAMIVADRHGWECNGVHLRLLLGVPLRASKAHAQPAPYCAAPGVRHPLVSKAWLQQRVSCMEARHA